MKRPNLENLSKELKAMLPKYCGISFLPFDTTIDVELKPAAKEKGYSAIATVPMGDITEAVIILFGPKNGTGAYTKKFSEGSLTIPKQYQFENKAYRVIPRPKDGLISELMLPIGSVIDDTIFPNVISLEQLGIRHGTNELFLEYHHGPILNTEQDVLDAAKAYKYSFPAQQDVRTTLWFNSLTGKKQGDPHAIYNSTNLWQLACFIGFKDKFPDHIHPIDCSMKRPNLILN